LFSFWLVRSSAPTLSSGRSRSRAAGGSISRRRFQLVCVS
jgi:hypothetical protein